MGREDAVAGRMKKTGDREDKKWAALQETGTRASTALPIPFSPEARLQVVSCRLNSQVGGQEEGSEEGWQKEGRCGGVVVVNGSHGSKQIAIFEGSRAWWELENKKKQLR